MAVPAVPMPESACRAKGLTGSFEPSFFATPAAIDPMRKAENGT